MEPETISQARNPLLAKALPALKRAALQARLVAAQTGTDLIVLENGQIRRIKISAEDMQGIREQSASDDSDSDGM